MKPTGVILCSMLATMTVAVPTGTNSSCPLVSTTPIPAGFKQGPDDLLYTGIQKELFYYVFIEGNSTNSSTTSDSTQRRAPLLAADMNVHKG
jgi:hypothetical protein